MTFNPMRREEIESNPFTREKYDGIDLLLDRFDQIEQGDRRSSQRRIDTYVKDTKLRIHFLRYF